MEFCHDHWDRLRQEIDNRGLSGLVAPDGETAMAQLVASTKQGATPTTYDPLMSAHWAIVDNVLEILPGDAGMYLLGGGEEDPVELDGYEGRTWPRCPLCYLNLAHEVSCTDEKCILDKVHGYDYFLERAADDEVEHSARVMDDS